MIEDAAGILHGVHFHEDEHDVASGLGLGATEVALEADLPSMFTARLSLALTEDDVHLEEAWIQTQELPHGLAVKAGRFLSSMGYLNGQHPHEQDFAGGNLVYDALLGPHGMLDSGVQASWQVPVPFFLSVGVEALQGREQERFGALVAQEDADAVVVSGAGLSDEKSGPRSGVFYLKAAPYLGEKQSLQWGASWLQARQFQQVIDEDESLMDDQFALQGRQALWGLDVAYAYDAEGQNGTGDVEVVTEYLHLKKDMRVTGADASAAVAVGNKVTGRQDGLYVQVVYGVAPRWQAGIRHEVIGMKNALREGGMTHSMADSHRTSVMMAYRPNAMSRLRVQWSSADIHDEAGDKTRLQQLSLGLTVALGGHAGHAH